MNQGFVGKTVVIVEDSMIIQNDLAQAYESLGMKVLSICGDGRTAIDQYQQYSPDLISLDIIIPDMHGIECYRTLKKAHANLKCLLFLLSRQIARSSRSAKMRYPGIFFFGKPVNVEDLENRLYKIFRGDDDANVESA
tara:strand:- start:395 stop:808 length:414 start_codon:yes stop_codon:yes gene_type:complete